MSIIVRKATLEDTVFIAQMLLKSTRADKQIGIFDLIFDKIDDVEILKFLEALVKTTTKHKYHYTNFLIAQIDDQKVGTLCTYESRIATRDSFIKSLEEIGIAINSNIEVVLKIFDECSFNLGNRVLMFDCMEELEDFIDIGVLKTLMQKSLLNARLKGYSVAQTIVESGSFDRLLYYKKLNFKEIRSLECELYKEYFGRLGLTLLSIEF
jgi:hypothetical protein